MDDVAWKTVTEIADRMHRQLDAQWNIEIAANMAGYQQHYFANLFRSVVGEPPAAYCRRLRLERAAYQLTGSAAPAQVARGAGYTSMEAFIRAFKKHFGVPPGRFREAVPPLGSSNPPAGLSVPPTIEEVGPFAAWTVIVPSFDPQRVATGMMQLLGACPPDGPWQLGGVAQPWGWIGAGKQEFRCMRLFPDPNRPLAAPAPPLVPWRWPRGLFAVFDYAGPQQGIVEACEWMAATWPATEGGREVGYGPLVSLARDFDPIDTRARLYLPVRDLPAVG